jgi:hypothetical protein
MDRRVWIPAAAAVAAALIGAAATITAAEISKSGGQRCEQSGHDNTQDCDVTPPKVDPSADSRAAAKTIFRDVPPVGRGPWPFAVLNDNVGSQNVGQYVLSAPNRRGHHVGLALHASTLWVECRLVTDFDPDPSSGNGPEWLRIHWSRNPATTTNAAGTSSPSGPFRGFVYAAYPAPDGSNGKVPTCS